MKMNWTYLWRKKYSFSQLLHHSSITICKCKHKQNKPLKVCSSIYLHSESSHHLLPGRDQNFMTGKHFVGEIVLPDHRLRYGFQAGWDLHPLLPLLSPRVWQHIEVVWAKLRRVWQLHGRDKVRTENLEKQE